MATKVRMLFQQGDTQRPYQCIVLSQILEIDDPVEDQNRYVYERKDIETYIRSRGGSTVCPATGEQNTSNVICLSSSAMHRPVCAISWYLMHVICMSFPWQPHVIDCNRAELKVCVLACKEPNFPHSHADIHINFCLAATSHMITIADLRRANKIIRLQRQQQQYGTQKQSQANADIVDVE